MTDFTIWTGWLILAQGADAPSPFNPSTVFIFVMMIAFFYLVVIRPQKKEADEKQKMLDALKKGDTVLTSSGMYGTVVKLEGDEVTIRVDEQTKAKVRFVKAAIARVVEASGGTAAEDAESDSATDEANKS